VTFGAVPDFTYVGPGVRLQAVTPGSPAAGAGLQTGDVIVGLDAVTVASLREFSNALRALAPGQTVQVRFRRGTSEQTVAVTLVER
jgi:putative serine protease PepD